MILTEDKTPVNYQIKAYTPGRVTINETEYHQSVIVMPDRVIEYWPPTNVKQLCPEHFDILLNTNTDIVLLGTGTQFMLPNPEQLAFHVECMNTAAACHTYIVLTSEGRDVAAALIL